MESTLMQYPPGDPRMIDTIVNQLKSQGIFDQFRKECIADVDTKPAYQNLHQRVEGTVSGFLAHQIWRPDLNKNQLRESLRKHIHESGFLDMGVERIVDQVVNPKIMSVLVPQVEDVVYKFIGIDKPNKNTDFMHSYPPAPYLEKKKDVSIADLLPKDLDPISPESDETKKSDASVEDGELDDKHIEDEESPPFEPIAEANDNSVGSHLSGISGLTSPDDQHSNISYNGGKTPPQPMLLGINNDSQLSKVSSGSHLSFNFGETYKPTEKTEQYSPMNIESNDSNSKSSFVDAGGDVIDKFEASDVSGSSDDQGKVTTTTKNVEMDTDSDSSSSTSDSDSARPLPSPGLGSCDEGLAAEEQTEKRDKLPAVVIERKEDSVLKEGKGEEQLNKIYEKEAVIIMKKEGEEYKSFKHDKEEKKTVKKDSKEEVQCTKDLAKDDEKLVRKEKEVKKSIRSDKEVSCVKKHKDGDKLVQKDKNNSKIDLKEKKEASVYSVKKNEKGKDLKNQDKEQSLKKEDKDKKVSKSEGPKEESRVCKDKSSKRSEEKEKSVKKEDKDKEKRKDNDGKRKDSSVRSHTSHKSDKDKHHSSKPKKHDDGDKSTKTDTSKNATKEDKERKDERNKSDDKQKPKNGQVEKERASKTDEKISKDKDRKMKEKEEVKLESTKYDRERKETKSKSTSDKSKDGGKRKEKGKLIDDHDKHREKRSEDRRSTDRDSNGTTRDRSSSSSHTASTSAKDAQRHENKGGGKTNNGGNSEASETTSKESKNDSAEMPLSPKSTLKKRALENREDVGEEYFCTSNEGKLTLKIKKPKIAANIFEVQKIIELRRSLAKLEMKRQQELSEVQKLSEEMDRDTMAKTEQSTPDDVPRKHVASESDDGAEDVKYFEACDENKSIEFIAFVKRLGRSRKLSEIDASSVSSNDLDYISDSELPDIEHLPPNYGLFPFPLVSYVPFSSATIDNTIDAVSRGLFIESPISPVQQPLMKSTIDVQCQMQPHLVLPKLKTGAVYDAVSHTSKIPYPTAPVDSAVSSKVNNIPVSSNNNSVNTETAVTETMSAEMKPPQISPSSLADKRETRRSRKPNMKYSSDDYSFVSDDNDADEPESLDTKRQAVGSYCKSPAIKRQKCVGENASDAKHPVDNNNKDETIGDTKETEQAKEMRLSSGKEVRLLAARRVGLSRPKVAAMTQVARVATPDFVMPLSPESDVSASSSELAKKSLVEMPSPSTSEEEVTAARGGEENKGSYRKGVVSGQRYTSDDLYKPRPLFNRASRRKRAASPTLLADDASVNGVVASDPCVVQQLACRPR